jgi:tetratricopeptide (TPR) repeat protein
MLKRGVIIFCLVSGLTALLGGKAVLRGIIVRQNSGGQPIGGVQVSAFGANTVWSHPSGKFELIFLDKNPGDTVVLTVKKEKLEVVDDDKLTHNLPSDPDRVITIVMCGLGQRDKYARELSSIVEKSINRNFEKLLKQIQDKEIDIREKAQKIAELEKQRDTALAQAKELAEQYFQKAISSDPNNFENIFKFAVFLQKQNQHLQARDLYEKALTLVQNDDEEATILNNLGLLYLEMGRKTEAVTSMQRALEIREKLAGINPEGFELDLCRTLISLSLVYGEMTEAGSEQSYRRRCLSMINRAITILEKYPGIPRAQKYLEIARQLKQNFEQPQDN